MASEGQKTGEGSGTADPAPPADAYPRLRHIEITNYKALDHLVLDIPAPTMPGDPDIFVVGSKNGLGKTSLLECCALAHLKRCDHWQVDSFFHQLRAATAAQDMPELCRLPDANLVIRAQHSDGASSEIVWHPSVRGTFAPSDVQGNVFVFIQQFFGRSANVLINPYLLLFHGYRKIREGTLPAQDMLAQERPEVASAVKLKAVRLLLASSGLVEGTDPADAERRLEQLNALLSSFAGGRIDKKLRPVGKDQLDLRIVTPRGTTFSFDGLSSGQKEIVTTLFLIWNETLAHPALVLIDEPELHLNAEWQREFLRHLLALAPKNQYILATHSEDIFASVSEERRVLLEASHG